MQIKLPPLPQIQSAVATVSGSTQRDPNSKNPQKRAKKFTVVKNDESGSDNASHNHPEVDTINQQLAPSTQVIEMLDHKPTAALQKVREFQKKSAPLPKKNPKGLNRVL